MVPAGRLQDRIGPRWVATAGGILTGIGFIIASYSVTLLWFVIGFGIFAGAGFGLGYASATPPAVKWFSARKTGLIAGLVVAGFGLASVYISPIANHLTGFTISGKPVPELELLAKEQTRTANELRHAQAALAAEHTEIAGKEMALKDADARLLALKGSNIHRTLFYFGIGFLIVVTLLSQFLVVPPPGYQPPDTSTGNAQTRQQRLTWGRARFSGPRSFTSFGSCMPLLPEQAS